MTTLAATLDVLYALRYIIAAITAALLVAFWYERGQRNLDAILAAELAQIDADRAAGRLAGIARMEANGKAANR